MRCTRCNSTAYSASVATPPQPYLSCMCLTALQICWNKKTTCSVVNGCCWSCRSFNKRPRSPASAHSKTMISWLSCRQQGPQARGRPVFSNPAAATTQNRGFPATCSFEVTPGGGVVRLRSTHCQLTVSQTPAGSGYTTLRLWCN